MVDEVFEILNQYMDKRIEGVGEQLDAVVNRNKPAATAEVPVNTVPTVVEKIRQPEQQVEQQESDDDLDFGDMPNGKIRYEKQKEKLKRLQEENEKLRTSQKKEDNSDSLAGMSEEEKDIFLKQQQREQEIENLKTKVSQMEDKEILQTLKQREENFWKNYTDAERIKYAPMMELEIRRSDLTEHVLSGKVSLEKVMAMVNPEAAKKAAPVQNPNTIRGSQNHSVPARVNAAPDSGFDIGQKVLNIPTATNLQRKQAVNLMTQDIVKGLISL